jgi:predicted small metal-binding protein
MAKRISCRDVGVDCDYEAQADSEAELMDLLERHAQTAHGMDEIPPEVVSEVKSKMQDI